MSLGAQSLDFGQGLLVPWLVSGFDEGLDLLDALGELWGFGCLGDGRLPGVRGGEMFFNEGLWGRLVVIRGLPCRQNGCERACSDAVWELGLWRRGSGHRRRKVLGRGGRWELCGRRRGGIRHGRLWCGGGVFESLVEGLTVGASGLELGAERDELFAGLVALETEALHVVAQIALLLLLASSALGDPLVVHVLASALPILEGDLEGGLVRGVARIGDVFHVRRADIAAGGVHDAIVVEELPGRQEGGYPAVVSDGHAVWLVAAGQWVHY